MRRVPCSAPFPCNSEMQNISAFGVDIFASNPTNLSIKHRTNFCFGFLFTRYASAPMSTLPPNPDIGRHL